MHIDSHFLGTSPVIYSPPTSRPVPLPSCILEVLMHGEENNRLPFGSQIPSFPSPSTDAHQPFLTSVSRNVHRCQHATASFLQRAAMNLEIWKLEDRSLQHVSSDHFNLVAYLVDTSLQKKQTKDPGFEFLKQPICIKECHDSDSVWAKPPHMKPPADHFRSFQLQTDFIASVSN